MKGITGFSFCILLLLFTVSTATAQRFRAGFTLAATATDVDGMDTRDHDDDFNKLGYMIGGIVNTKLDQKNDFQMEINYVKKGTAQFPDSNNMGSYKLALDYVEIPFILKHHIHINIRKKSVDNFEWEVGASVGRMVRHTWDLGNYPYPMNLSNMNMTDVSLLIGFSYNFSSHVALSFRYTNSVIPAIKHDHFQTFQLPYYFNTGNNLVFQMGIKFIFGGTAEKKSE